MCAPSSYDCRTLYIGIETPAGHQKFFFFFLVLNLFQTMYSCRPGGPIIFFHHITVLLPFLALFKRCVNVWLVACLRMNTKKTTTKKSPAGISINNGLASLWQPSRLSAWHTTPPKVSSEFIWSCSQQYSSQSKMPRLHNTSQSGHRATVNQNYNALDVCIRSIKHLFPPIQAQWAMIPHACWPQHPTYVWMYLTCVCWTVCVCM